MPPRAPRQPFIEIDWIPHPYVVAAQFYELAGDVEVRSLREPLRRCIKEVFAPAFVENFQAEGRPPWTPLAEATLERKKGPGILHESGDLRRKAGQLNMWTIDGIKAEARADQANQLGVGYGIVHQEGYGPIPARPWATVTEQDIDKAEEVFGRWLDERISVTIGGV